MIAGRFAFQGLSEYLTWQKIKQLDYSFPENFDEDAMDLIQRLLVREPSDRLGAGPPGSDHDMKALRAHRFFETVQWETLWTDPAPPLEAGLVKRSPAQEPCLWNDVGADWDGLVADQGLEDDGIEWAEDAEPGRGAIFIRRATHAQEDHHEDSGNTNRIGNGAGQGSGMDGNFGGYEFPQANAVIEKSRQSNEKGGLEVVSEPIQVPVPPRDRSTGSASSSEGSPVERLGAMLESVSLKRGRDRCPTPVQGNLPLAEEEGDWSSLMRPGETMLFKSKVEVRPQARRASKLITIVVPPMKAKKRTLMLTTQRLLCVKIPAKGRGLSVKAEFPMLPSDTRKDSVMTIIGVEPKGEREFVVMTTSKSYQFVAENARTASTWIQKINDLRERSPSS